MENLQIMLETLPRPAPPTPDQDPSQHGSWFVDSPATVESVPSHNPAALLATPNQVTTPPERTPSITVRYEGDPIGQTTSVLDADHHAGQTVDFRTDDRTSQLKSFNHEALINLADGSTLYWKNDSIYSIDFNNPKATTKLVELDLEKETPGFVMGEGSWAALAGITESPVVGLHIHNKHRKDLAKHPPMSLPGKPDLEVHPGLSPFSRADESVAEYRKIEGKRSLPGLNKLLARRRAKREALVPETIDVAERHDQNELGTTDVEAIFASVDEKSPDDSRKTHERIVQDVVPHIAHAESEGNRDLHSKLMERLASTIEARWSGKETQARLAEVVDAKLAEIRREAEPANKRRKILGKSLGWLATRRTTRGTTT